MAAVLAFNGWLRVFKDNGDICTDARATWRVAGSSTPTDTYTTNALSVANANPVEANALGVFPEMWLNSEIAYKVIISGTGVTTRTIDNVYTAQSLGEFATDVRYIGVPGGAAYQTGGSANAYTITTSLSLDSVPTFATFLMQPSFTNTGAATLNIDGLGAAALRVNGIPLQGGELISGSQYIVQYSGSVYNIITPNNSAVVPASGGRLTLSSTDPTLGTSGSTIYLLPFISNVVPVYYSNAIRAMTFSSVSLPLSATYHPSGAFDVFVFLDGTTLRLGTGPAWTSTSSRGTGAGTTEITRLASGVHVNTVSITLRWGTNLADTTVVAANQAVYLGSFVCSSAGTVTDANSTNQAGLWNRYNRVPRIIYAYDSTDSWNYSTAAWRLMNNTAANSVVCFKGLNFADTISVRVLMQAVSSGATQRTVRCAIGDVALNPQGASLKDAAGVTSTLFQSLTASFVGAVPLGSQSYHALEYGGGTDTQTWYGDAGGTLFQSGIQAETLQ